MHLRPVLGQQGRRHEGQTRVLHTSIRKAGGQDEEVVGTPLVWAAQLLANLQQLLSLLELPSTVIDHLLLAPDQGARTNAAAFQGPADQRDQVIRDGELLLES